MSNALHVNPLYAEAMHGPIEAPAHYVGNAHCSQVRNHPIRSNYRLHLPMKLSTDSFAYSQVTTLNNRNIYCGMMAALDEGIGAEN